MEDGKDPKLLTRARVVPHRLLHLLVLFLVLCITVCAVSIYTTKYFGVYTSLTNISPRLIPCNVQEATNVDQWIKSRSNVMHNMSDNELLWRASTVPRVKKYPFNRVPKIAFMFLTKGPLPLSPLWERFFKGHFGKYSIYVHSLPYYLADFSPSSVFYQRQVPSKISEWGKMSMCDAERRLLANALLDISNERFVLLSESCIPLYNFTTIYHYLTRSKYSFMGSFDDPGPYGRGRYNENMSPEVNISQWRKGSQWFEVNRKLALSITEDTKLYPKFDEFCKAPCYVDEHYFPTLLTIREGNMLANRSVTWVDWSRGGAHPATFGGGDITEEFMRRVYGDGPCLYNDEPTSICSLFARKFSPNALEALFLVAPNFLGY